MKKLTIAIDCDDVLVPSTEQIVDLYNKTYGTHVTLENAHSSSNPEWKAPRETIAERIYAIQRSEEYVSTPPFQAAIEACRRLARHHELHLVTARPDEIMPITMAMLDQYFPDIFSEVEHVGFAGNKGEVCQRLSADVLIDDNFKHLQAAQECGIAHLFWYGNYPWQEEKSDVVRARRCRDWQELEAEIDKLVD